MPMSWGGQSLGEREGIFEGLELQDHPGPTPVLHAWPHTSPALGLRLLRGKGSFYRSAVRLCGAVELSMELGGSVELFFGLAPGQWARDPHRTEPSPASQALSTPSPVWTLPSLAYSPGVGVRSCGAVGSAPPPPCLRESLQQLRGQVWSGVAQGALGAVEQHWDGARGGGGNPSSLPRGVGGCHIPAGTVAQPRSKHLGGFRDPACS